MNKNRYQRQIILKDFGEKSQMKLSAARVLVVGVGGLGIPVLQYLNAMGVGTLGMVEQDVIEATNLHRQVLYSESDIGQSKIEVAAKKLKQQNSNTEIITYDTFLIRQNALDIIRNFDLVVDATDNFAARYLINDACVILNKPFVYGALHGFEGQVSVFNYKDGPTYRCLFPKMPAADEIPDCNQHGVLGVLPGIVGNFQALEAVKILTGIGEVLSGRLMIYNGMDHSMVKISIKLHEENRKISALQDRYEVLYCDPSYEIQAAEWEEFLRSEKTALIVDVRSAEEFKNYSLKGSVNVPLDELQTNFTVINDQRLICLVCQSGLRSQKALYWLKDQGMTKRLYHLKGGLNAYRILHS